jgi:hypothetical protein
MHSYSAAHRASTRIQVFVNKGSSPTKEPGLYDTMSKVMQIKQLVGAKSSIKHNVLEPKRFTTDLGERVGFISTKDLQQDEVRVWTCCCYGNLHYLRSMYTVFRK